MVIVKVDCAPGAITLGVTEKTGTIRFPTVRLARAWPNVIPAFNNKTAVLAATKFLLISLSSKRGNDRKVYFQKSAPSRSSWCFVYERKVYRRRDFGFRAILRIFEERSAKCVYGVRSSRAPTGVSTGFKVEDSSRTEMARVLVAAMFGGIVGQACKPTPQKTRKK